MQWLTKDWWQYLLEKPCNLRKFFCRIHGHKCGVWWYTLSMDEPNMECKNCEDWLG